MNANLSSMTIKLLKNMNTTRQKSYIKFIQFNYFPSPTQIPAIKTKKWKYVNNIIS